MAAGHVLLVLGGAAVVLYALGSAVRMVILPRAAQVRMVRAVFLTVRITLTALAGRSASYARRDAIMAMYAPLALLGVLGAWLAMVVIGYTAIYWGFAGRSLRGAFELSGSSGFTLGTTHASDLPSEVLGYVEAALALLLLALLISYLPTLYGAFSRREAAVASLETRAGSPPSAAVFIERLSWIHGLSDMTDLWERWEWWFQDLQESHTSYPVIAFFRSPLPDHSWVTAGGAVLDTAAMVVSCLDRPPDPAAQLCLRAGSLALRRVAAMFRIPFDPDPSPTHPISVSRAELEVVLDDLEAAGVRLKTDRDQIWRDFAGWRVNYDGVIRDLASLVVAPLTPWISDRAGDWRPWWMGSHPHV